MTTIHLSKAVMEPWAILPESLAVITEIVTRHFSGEKLDPDEVQMRIHGAKRPESRIILAGPGMKPSTSGIRSVAVLPLFGTIFPRANLMTDVSGATSAEMFGKQFDELVNDPEIGAIVLDVDSPGGQVNGIEELGQKIFDARGTKPVVAVANHLMASAAYWIGTAADQVMVSPSAEVGSIGVVAMHQDVSAALAERGIKVTFIQEGKYKTAGNSYEPLGEEARAVIQNRVSEYYDSFVNAVARNRGVDADAVRNGFGEGFVVGAQQAVDLGMADQIATLEETITRLQRGWKPAGKMGAGVVIIIPPGYPEDSEEVIPGEAAAAAEAEPDNDGDPDKVRVEQAKKDFSQSLTIDLLRKGV